MNESAEPLPVTRPKRRSGSDSLTTSSNAARWLVMIVSVVNIVATVVVLWLMWKTTAAAGTSLPTRIDDSVAVGTSLLFAVVVFLIAWQGADQPANLMLALAFAFAGSNGIFGTAFEELRANLVIRELVEIPTFILGAGFFIRASQQFPRKLRPADIASRRTIWGRITPVRAVLIFFLYAPAVWTFIATGEILAELSGNETLIAINWVCIALMGLIYFHIMYRLGDMETRRKVLWLFELTLVTLVLKLLWLSARAVLHDRSSQTVGVVVSVVLNSARPVAQLFCICMAVFWAGAISPALVIRKTFVYGATAALLIFTYAIFEGFVTNFLSNKIGVSNNFANAVLGAVLALAFHPIKSRMEGRLKHTRLGEWNRKAPTDADVSREA